MVLWLYVLCAYISNLYSCNGLRPCLFYLLIECLRLEDFITQLVKICMLGFTGFMSTSAMTDQIPTTFSQCLTYATNHKKLRPSTSPSVVKGKKSILKVQTMMSTSKVLLVVTIGNMYELPNLRTHFPICFQFNSTCSCIGTTTLRPMMWSTLDWLRKDTANEACIVRKSFQMLGAVGYLTGVPFLGMSVSCSFNFGTAAAQAHVAFVVPPRCRLPAATV
jgi:hypothetical protein